MERAEDIKNVIKRYEESAARTNKQKEEMDAEIVKTIMEIEEIKRYIDECKNKLSGIGNKQINRENDLPLTSHRRAQSEATPRFKSESEQYNTSKPNPYKKNKRNTLIPSLPLDFISKRLIGIENDNTERTIVSTESTNIATDSKATNGSGIVFDFNSYKTLPQNLRQPENDKEQLNNHSDPIGVKPRTKESVYRFFTKKINGNEKARQNLLSKLNADKQKRRKLSIDLVKIQRKKRPIRVLNNLFFDDRPAKDKLDRFWQKGGEDKRLSIQGLKQKINLNL